MRIIIKGRNIEVTGAIRDYVEKRLGKLEKYIDGIDEVQVTLLVVKGRHRVEVTLPINGYIIRSEEENFDMYTSVDLVEEKLEKQIQKYKIRYDHKGRKVKGMPPVAAEIDEEEPRIVRTKRFAYKPMPVDEAVLQMDLLGHSFYVFSNAETNQVNVVYKRKDGNYGLIEPEF